MGGKCEMPWKKLGTIRIRGRNRRRILQATTGGEPCPPVRRSWSHPQEPTGEEWWADVLADPRARKRERRTDLAVKQVFYRLADEKREIILVACSKCEWRAAFARVIALHGADCPMPNLLNHLAAPNCSRLGSNWDRCGVHYVEPIETDRRGE